VWFRDAADADKAAAELNGHQLAPLPAEAGQPPHPHGRCPLVVRRAHAPGARRPGAGSPQWRDAQRQPHFGGHYGHYGHHGHHGSHGSHGPHSRSGSWSSLGSGSGRLNGGGGGGHRLPSRFGTERGPSAAAAAAAQAPPAGAAVAAGAGSSPRASAAAPSQLLAQMSLLMAQSAAQQQHHQAAGAKLALTASSSAGGSSSARSSLTNGGGATSGGGGSASSCCTPASVSGALLAPQLPPHPKPTPSGRPLTASPKKNPRSPARARRAHSPVPTSLPLSSGTRAAAPPAHAARTAAASSAYTASSTAVQIPVSDAQMASLSPHLPRVREASGARLEPVVSRAPGGAVIEVSGGGRQVEAAVKLLEGAVMRAV
jgi:hypothetical protein